MLRMVTCFWNLERYERQTIIQKYYVQKLLLYLTYLTPNYSYTFSPFITIELPKHMYINSEFLPLWMQNISQHKS